MAKNDHLVQDKNEKEATCSGAPSETSSAESRAYTPIRACQDVAQLCCLMAKNNRVAQDNANMNARAMALQETQGKRNLRVQTKLNLQRFCTTLWPKKKPIYYRTCNDSSSEARDAEISGLRPSSTHSNLQQCCINMPA